MILLAQLNELGLQGVVELKNWKKSSYSIIQIKLFQQVDYMDFLEKSYPDQVTVKEIGKSFEGRPLKVIVIKSAPVVDENNNLGVDEEKPVIWIDGGFHAREWISPATAFYVARELIQNTKGDEGYFNRKLLQQFDFHIMPMANPDGYKYSQEVNRSVTFKSILYCNFYSNNIYFSDYGGKLDQPSDSSVKVWT
jgi:murein tripeptide amidase MpaA